MKSRAIIQIGGAFLALLGFAVLASQQARAQTSTRPCFYNASGQCVYISAGNPLPVNASVSASISGFAPATTGTPISVTTGGNTGTLPAGGVVAAFNVGTTNTAYCKLGGSATTSDIAIPPASWFAFTVGVATQLTCITSTSTTTVNMVGGDGLPTGAGGGGGGSGGGTTNVTQLNSQTINLGNGNVGTGTQRVTIAADSTGTVAATQSGAWTVNPTTLASWGIGATGASVPANAVLMGMSQGGNTTALTGASGSLNVVCTSGCSGSGGTASNYGSAFPSAGTAAGFSDGTNMVAAKVGAIANVTAATNMLNVLGAAQYNASPLTVTDTRYQSLQSDVNGFLKVNVTNANANGQATMANSSPVVIASNQSAIAAAGQGATGAAPPSGAQYLGANASGATGGLLAGLKTCDTHAKYDASDNGSITLVTGVSGRKVYICGFIMATGGTATNLKLREGSDANCASNAADLTPAYQLVANDRIGMQSPFWTGLVVSTNAYYVCINASAGNAHQAEIWYTIQ